MKKYLVELTLEERGQLIELTRKGECEACRLKRALVLLAADEWCFPEVGAEFVALMEGVPELYEEPYDPGHPVVCFDEMPVQLIGETRAPRPPAPGRRERYDCEYRRNRMANLFMHFEPKAGEQHVDVTESRKKVDFAGHMKWLVDERHPEAERVRVVTGATSTPTNPARPTRPTAPRR